MDRKLIKVKLKFLALGSVSNYIKKETSCIQKEMETLLASQETNCEQELVYSSQKKTGKTP